MFRDIITVKFPAGKVLKNLKTGERNYFMRRKRKPLRGSRKLHIRELPWLYIMKSFLVLVICVVLIYQFIGFRHYYEKSVEAYNENNNLESKVSLLSTELTDEKTQKESIIAKQLTMTEDLRNEIDTLSFELDDVTTENEELLSHLNSTKSQNDTLRQKLETLLGSSSRSGSTLEPSVTGRSGLNLAELQKLTSGTGLVGIEEALLTIELVNDVNALFALSVAKLESGNGRSFLSTNQNNIFGFRGRNGWMTFDSKVDCVLYFGELIENHYVGKGYNTLAKIGPRYAEGSTSWAVKVQEIMLSDMRKAHR